MVALAPVTAVTTWQFVPLIGIPLVILVICYLAGTRLTAGRHPGRPWPRGRTVSFLAGLAVIAVATEGSDAVYDDVLLSAHMVQHLLLIMLAPVLLVYARPVTLLLHATRNPWHRRVKRLVRSRAVTALTCPQFVVVLYWAIVLTTHLTPLILAKGPLHDGEHLAYLVAGYLLFLPVIGSEPGRRMSFFGRYLLLLAVMPTDIIVGAAYMLSGPFGGYAQADVHEAGLIMLVGGELAMTALATVLAAGLVRSPHRRAAALPDLRAYNAYLASLNRADRTPAPPPRAGEPGP